jgi:subfamily B ATP-binding cassette protein MsbA
MVLSPPLTLMAAPIFIFCGWVIRFQLVRGRNFGRLITDNNTEFSEIVNEAMQGIRLLKMRSFEKTTAQRLYERAKTVAYSNIDLQRIRSGLEATAQPFLIIGTFGVLYIAVQHLDMRLAELGMFMLLIARATPLLIQINTSRLAIHGSIESHLRIDRMSAAAAAVPEAKSGNKPFTGMTSGIEFDRVSFSYDRDDVKIPALRGVSFVAAKGKTLALVGPSGAGKSTLVDLIPRFHEPQSGAVKIDGDPIESFELSSLRQRIAFVTQETVLFHASIRGNIEIGLAEPLSDAKLRECLEKSHCTEFVDRLPQGVETEIGERGMQLSGGQRQRLALARALAQDSEVLVLDEPTSALDSISEAAIQASLDALRGQMTVIVIAHRLATIRHADLIVVLDEGKVVGRGTHESLMANTGTYRDLVDMQRL